MVPSYDVTTIWLDDNAAGWGWFIDSTPADDSEFVHPGNQGEINRMDLLSVVMHELGHILGRDHEDVGPMAEVLAAGVRSTFAQAEQYAPPAMFDDQVTAWSTGTNEFAVPRAKRRR